MTGKIIKALSGFYYVRSEDGEITECRARGRFRREHITPLVGDRVEFSAECGHGTVEEILPRMNSFLRPAVANLDALVVFASGVIPVTEPFLIDRITAAAAFQDVSVIICVNKCDLDSGEKLIGIYRHAGYRVIATSAETCLGIEELREAIRGNTVVFNGNSGVGKSSILNRLNPGFHVPVGEVSNKLGRGRHTTRHVELYALGNETYVVDTPGFSSFDEDFLQQIPAEKLQYAFPDFLPYLGHCQFNDCTHIHEPGCGVLAALDAGKIEPTRHESYVRLYEKAKEIKPWKVKSL